MKRPLIFSLAVLVLFVTTGASSISLRRSEATIRESILSFTPLGTSPDAVQAFVKKEGWKSQGFDSRSGFIKQEPSGKSEVIGTSHIHASLGHHWTFPFLRTDVTAYWGFDKDGGLVDVWIWKTTDAP